jgi:hypothetical protein
MADDETTSQSWTHTASVAGCELLFVFIGNKLIDVVMLPVDENGLPI